MAVNAITVNGMTIQQFNDVVDELTNGATVGSTTYPGILQTYPNANLDPNSRDAQIVNIVALAKTDVLEMALQVFNSFDPDQASGTVLDWRCAINGVVRMAGSPTIVQVVITYANANTTLQGLDNYSPTLCFAVVDNQNNKYLLETTTLLSGTGTVTLTFQSATSGEFNPAPHAITQAVQNALGIVTVDNPYAAAQIGTPPESDATLRVRRQNSVALPSSGFLDGLYAGLLSIPGVSQAQVYENRTSVTDSNGIPGHSIWPIIAPSSVQGYTVLPALVANQIFSRLNAGCGMRGAQTFVIAQLDGNSNTMQWDWALNANLWMEMSVAAIGVTSYDAGAIAETLLNYFGQGPTGGTFTNDVSTYTNPASSFGIGSPADTSAMVAVVKNAYPTVAVGGLNVGVATQVLVNVTTTAPNVSLRGLDANTASACFKVSDGTHAYILLNSTTILASGVTTLTFIGDAPDARSAAANTLTTILTAVTGVSAVNNPAIQQFRGVPYTEGLLYQPSIQYQFSTIPALININGSPAL